MPHDPYKNDSFDDLLAHYEGHAPTEALDAAIDVTDTMHLAWSATQSLFGKQATPELALALYDRIERKRARRTTRPKDQSQRARTQPPPA